MNRICKDCGAEFDGKPKSRFCPSCRLKRTQEGQRKRNASVRAMIKSGTSYKKPVLAKRKIEPIVQKIDITQCKKCVYRTWIDNTTIGCGYLIHTGHRRQSEPSPNCTVFKKDFRKEDVK